MTVAEARQSKPRQPTLRRSAGTGIAWRVGCTTAGSAAGGKTRGPCTGGAGTWVASSGLESAGMDSITRKAGAAAVGPTLDRMDDVTLLLQPPQHGANRRFLEAPRQFLAYGLCREATIGPYQLHHLALEVAQVRHAFAHRRLSLIQDQSGL